MSLRRSPSCCRISSAGCGDPAKFKIGVQSRQTGKSFGTACEAVNDAIRDPGTKWVCLSAGERQALEWLEKAKEWAEAFRTGHRELCGGAELGEALLKQAEIRFANGSRIIAIPANPSTARGYSANVVLDEFAYHEDPDKIWAAMFPSLTNPLAGTFQAAGARALRRRERPTLRRDMKIRVVSTFNGRENKFFSSGRSARPMATAGTSSRSTMRSRMACRWMRRSSAPASMTPMPGRRSTSASRRIRAMCCCLTT